jgi:hypothetical protein
MFVVDCAEDYSAKGSTIKAFGAAGVMRYFNPLTNGHDSGKSLTPAEARRWAVLGMPVGIVVEGYGMANGKGVDGPSGTRDAREVLAWLPSVGLPPSSSLCVYFAVDTDATATQINTNEVAYFDAINVVFNELPASRRPTVGSYGSGWTCLTMQGTKRVTNTWVAGSPGWAHYKDYVASNAWTLLQKIYPGERWQGMNMDTNTVQKSLADAGLLIPFAPVLAAAASATLPQISTNPRPPVTQHPPVTPLPPAKGFWATVIDSFKKM